MGECELCDGDNAISYTCNECGGTFCSSHRLPENHRCEALLSKDSEGWFKEDLSVRKNRGSTRITGNSAAGEPGKVDTGSDARPTTGPGMVCSDCDRAAQAKCGDCGVPYCEKHRTPETHDCTPIRYNEPESVSDRGDEKQIDSEVTHPDCVTCSRDARFECEECGQTLCLRHRRQVNHDCPASSHHSSDTGILGSVKDALFGN